MSIDLSWDLFILAFFGVVIAYSFIIGRNQTLKVVSATYIAIICADAFGNLFERYLISSEPFMKFLRLFAVASPEHAIAFAKVFVLISLVVIVAVRGAYDFSIDDDQPFAMKMSISFFLGILSAGLLMSTILIFIAGGSLVATIAKANSPLIDLYLDSKMIRLMLDYSNLWFLGPGATIVFISLFIDKKA
jgi:hypothetical protein